MELFIFIELSFLKNMHEVQAGLVIRAKEKVQR